LLSKLNRNHQEQREKQQGWKYRLGQNQIQLQSLQ